MRVWCTDARFFTQLSECLHLLVRDSWEQGETTGGVIEVTLTNDSRGEAKGGVIGAPIPSANGGLEGVGRTDCNGPGEFQLFGLVTCEFSECN